MDYQGIDRCMFNIENKCKSQCNGYFTFGYCMGGNIGSGNAFGKNGCSSGLVYLPTCKAIHQKNMQRKDIFYPHKLRMKVPSHEAFQFL